MPDSAASADAFAALARLLARRRGGPVAVGLYNCRGGRATLRHATADFETGDLDLTDLAGTARGGVARLTPDRVAGAGLVAVAPVTGHEARGLLVVACRRTRRLTRPLAEAIADAAVLAGPLIDAGDPTARAALRPRPGARRRVEAALRGLPAAALLMLDLDRFRSVNEALGMPAGDALLAASGARIEAVLGPSDRLVRLEGDRFVVVTPDAPAEALRALARRLMRAIGQPLPIGDRELSVQASIGIVAGVDPEVPVSATLLRADTALRRAKGEGRNRFALHGPGDDATASERGRIELDLAGAVAAGQMHLAFQPYIDLGDGRISGVEALLRWRHPTRGEMRPASFIPAAEASGLIVPLGRWALRRAMTVARHWPQRLTLSVNVSPLQFHQRGFVAEVEAALADTGFPARRLELEITEAVLMRDNPETIAQLRALIARGIRIALDDFGTGYSALAYLTRLPHHRIKLDKGFVQDLANPATAELIRAIIALARAQGIAVTAEGVERPEHLAAVRRAGFTHAQGFATGVPVADPSAMIAERPAALAD